MSEGRAAGAVWIEEAEIVPADESTVSTTVETTSFLNRVGANAGSVMKTDKDRATVAHWQSEISKGTHFSVKLHLDAEGNVIGADGRHRAIAALRSGVKRIHVDVTRRKG